MRIASRMAVVIALSIFVAACGDRPSDVPKNHVKVPQDVVNVIHAIDAGDHTELKRLLDEGATPTPPGSPLSPIHAAATHLSNGQLVCDAVAFKMLLDHGADPNFIDEYSGFSALEDALMMGDMECARLLREAGVDLKRQGRSGQTILQFAVKGAALQEDTAILKLVLSWGVDPNMVREGHRSTALHQAVWSNRGYDTAPIVAELLRSGVDPCIADDSGTKPLDLAINLDASDAIKKLLTDASRSCPSS